jgi:hypothetical protein
LKGYGKTELQIIIASALLGFFFGAPLGGGPLYGLIGAIVLPVLVFAIIVPVSFVASRRK